MIEEMKKEDLPNLVDQRRFRRREPEDFERDEYGRVRPSVHLNSASLTIATAQVARREDLRRS